MLTAIVILVVTGAICLWLHVWIERESEYEDNNADTRDDIAYIEWMSDDSER